MENKFQTNTRNRFAELEERLADDYEINEVHTCSKGAWTRLSSMTSNLAGVTKPLASAAQVVASGKRIILDPEPEKSFVENVQTGEKMRLRQVCVVRHQCDSLWAKTKIKLDPPAAHSIGY